MEELFPKYPPKPEMGASELTPENEFKLRDIPFDWISRIEDDYLNSEERLTAIKDLFESWEPDAIKPTPAFRKYKNVFKNPDAFAKYVDSSIKRKKDLKHIAHELQEILQLTHDIKEQFENQLEKMMNEKPSFHSSDAQIIELSDTKEMEDQWDAQIKYINLELARLYLFIEWINEKLEEIRDLGGEKTKL